MGHSGGPSTPIETWDSHTPLQYRVRAKVCFSAIQSGCGRYRHSRSRPVDPNRASVTVLIAPCRICVGREGAEPRSLCRLLAHSCRLAVPARQTRSGDKPTHVGLDREGDLVQHIGPQSSYSKQPSISRHDHFHRRSGGSLMPTNGKRPRLRSQLWFDNPTIQA